MSTPAVVTPRRSLGLWRLELLRLRRTRRGLLLLATYPLLALVGPLAVRHLDDILDVLGADAGRPTITDPADGMSAYTYVAGQVGLLVALGIAAAAFAVDHRPGLAAFYRTRTRHGRDLVLPRWTVTTTAVVLAYLAGTAVALAQVRWLFGPFGLSAAWWGAVYGALYLVLATAVVAGVGAFLRRPVTMFGAALAVLFLLPLPQLWSPAERWSPSRLGGAQVELLRDTTPGDYAGGAAVGVALTVALVWLAVYRVGRRET